MSLLLSVVGLALLAVALLALVPAVVLFLELVAAGPVPLTTHDTPRGPGRLAVLMPAHDEASGIEPSIRAVLAQLRPGDRLLVVADNCTDGTASVARASGADVVERHDTTRRGKGYALDFGVRWLESDPPDLVVIVDADCILGVRAIDRLAVRCLETGCPVQSLNLMHAPTGSPVGQRIAEFAWLIRNQVRPLGAAVWGWPCQLMGTGMALPWSIIQAAPLATGDIAEDMQLGLDLAAAGTPPVFCPQASLDSLFPVDRAAVKSQRTRWEHGHFSVITQAGPRLMRLAIARRDARLAAMVLDLTVPPLASLVMLLVLLTAASVLAWLAGAGGAASVVALLALGLVTAGVVRAWAMHARHLVGGRELLGLPGYVLAKIPVYLRLFTRRQVEWVRTKRDEQSH